MVLDKTCSDAIVQIIAETRLEQVPMMLGDPCLV
jgi:hypothetical protein